MYTVHQMTLSFSHLELLNTAHAGLAKKWSFGVYGWLSGFYGACKSLFTLALFLRSNIWKVLREKSSGGALHL
jgi:hypothetical protein